MQISYEKLLNAVARNEKMREKYKPPNTIKLLLVGESPPDPERGVFFYDEIKRCPLTNITKKAFLSAHGNPKVDNFLDYFRRCDCYLEDLSHMPVYELKPISIKSNDDEQVKQSKRECNEKRKKALDMHLTKCAPELADRIKQLRPNFIVVIVKSIEKYFRLAVDKLEIRPTIRSPLPFPFHRQSREDDYVSGLCNIIKECNIKYSPY